MKSSQPNYRSRRIWISPMFENSLTLKLLVSASIVVGIICYCESSPFQHLYGETKPMKIAVCVMVSVGGLIIICGVFYAEKLQAWKPGQLWLIAFVVTLVLMVTSLYSFYYDKKVAGRPDIFIAISNGAFVFMSLALSKLIRVEFELGLSNYFLGCFTTLLMKINLWLIIPAAFVCYIVTFLRYHPHSEVPRGKGDIESSGELRNEAQAQESEETCNTGTTDRVEEQVLTDSIAARTESIIPESVIPEPTIEEIESITLRRRKKGTMLPPEGTRLEAEKQVLTDRVAEQTESVVPESVIPGPTTEKIESKTRRQRKKGTMLPQTGTRPKRLSVTPMKMEAPASPSISRILRLDVPIDTYPNFDFVRELRGYSGASLKGVAFTTGCQVYIRGKGSMEDPDEEEKLRGRPGYERLNEPLHILIVADLPADIVDMRIQEARERIEEILEAVRSSPAPVMTREAPVSPSIRRILRLEVPVDTYPNFDFVRQLGGPRGITRKQVEATTGCHVYLRGKGSIKDPKKEEKLRGRPGYEHLSEPLHILIVADLPADIVDIRIQEAREIIEESLKPF